MEKQKTIVPWFRRGDIGGMSYSITNNIVNYLIVIATLSGSLLTNAHGLALHPIR